MCCSYLRAPTPIEAQVKAAIDWQYREQGRQEKRDKRGPIKTVTINRNLALLKHMFSYAIREEWFAKNPVRQVKFWKENNVRDRVLDPEEFQSLQAHSAHRLQAINLMAYQTGLRSGEILGLEWGRVDFKAGLIRLRPEDTKTEEARFITLTPELTHLLRDLYKVLYLHMRIMYSSCRDNRPIP